MEFPHGQTVHRDRRSRIPDPFKPDRTTEGDFDPELTITLPGSFVASSSSTALPDATRSQLLEAKSLFLTIVTADVAPRDRIRVGGTAEDLDSGVPYAVETVPEADFNPFTGWQPVKEVPLERWEG